MRSGASIARRVEGQSQSCVVCGAYIFGGGDGGWREAQEGASQDLAICEARETQDASALEHAVRLCQDQLHVVVAAATRAPNTSSRLNYVYVMSIWRPFTPPTVYSRSITVYSRSITAPIDYSRQTER